MFLCLCPLPASCGTPPEVLNAKLFGKKRPRYETHAMVRYYCTEGFLQRFDPVIKCLISGHWEGPQITCTGEEPLPLLIILTHALITLLLHDMYPNTLYGTFGDENI